MVNTTDLPVPQVIEAERAVLGSAMAHTAAYERLRPVLEAEDFYRPAHALIWTAMATLHARGKPIDPMAVMLELRETGELARAGGGTYLAELVEAGATPAAYDAAVSVHECHRVRRLLQVHTRMGQIIAEQIGDHEALLSGLAREAINLEVLVDEHTGEAPIQGLMHWSEAWNRFPSESVGWLIPDLLVAEDVWMLLGGEGGGKSWLARQFALCLAAGVHPLHPGKRIAPLRTVLVDGENSPAMVAYESRVIGHQVARLGEFNDELAYLVHRQAGMNLREKKAARELERIVAQTEAQVLILGPLYKMFKRGKDDWEHAAEDVQGVIDRIRERYGCAVIIEHHMAKASSSGERRPDPYGSSTWMRWPSLGHTVTRVGPNAWELVEFRGNRLAREMPAGLSRNGPLPWMPIWTSGELDSLRWQPAARANKASGTAKSWGGQQ